MIHYLNSKLFHRSANTFFSAMMNEDKFRITTLARELFQYVADAKCTKISVRELTALSIR
jgi:hypothetical protein